MKSRITIEVDFDNNNQPVIQILQYPDSEDVRDKLIKKFIQIIGPGSWCRFVWKIGGNDHNRIMIEPIKPEDLNEQSAMMLKESNVYQNFVDEHQPTTNG